MSEDRADPKDPLGLNDMFESTAAQDASEEELLEVIDLSDSLAQLERSEGGNDSPTAGESAQKQWDEMDSADFMRTMFRGSRRARKAEYQRRSLEHAAMLGADIEEVEYGYLIDFSDDGDSDE